MIKCEPSREDGVARIGENSIQTVFDHLLGTSDLSSLFGKEIEMPKTCELLGLLHDVGKYSSAFFDKIVQNNAELVDHSTGGAQFIQEHCIFEGKWGHIIKQMLSLIVMSHHSGLIDIINPSGEDCYSLRLCDKNRSNYDEIKKYIKPEIKNKLNKFNLGCIASEFENTISKFPKRLPFYFGLLSRFLLSCLVDADCLDAERFCFKDNFDKRNRQEISWDDLVYKLNMHLSSKRTVSELDRVRKTISEQCEAASGKTPGIYSLTLPTGSGKTLASMRFAFNHAKTHKMKRVIYVAPYTSIIDQNADVMRSVLGEFEDIMLEHHSNMISDDDEYDKGSDPATDNWDSQIIFTTMVQFLNTLFSTGTSSVRRMHNLSHSVIILDEIQSLPIKCISLFNSAVNFLAQVCGSTIITCTATEPPLCDAKRPLGTGCDIVKLHQETASVFERVRIKDMREKRLDSVQIAELAVSKAKEKKNVLFIANTKHGAWSVFKQIKKDHADAFHLSTNMCPAHRKKTIDLIKESLGSRKGTVCVSTQLIEAGVDLDFDVAIRAMAGLDAIIQSAGRCNRNGNMSERGEVVIVDFDEQSKIPDDIMKEQRAAERSLREHSDDPIGAAALKDYYSYYFHMRESEMDYTIRTRNITLFDLLNFNKDFVTDYCRINSSDRFPHPMPQSFKTANKEFRVIDSDKIGVITEYGEGIKVADDIARMNVRNNHPEIRKLLRKGQNYSIEVYEKKLKELMDQGKVREITDGSGTYRMIGCYDEETGFTE